MVQNTLNSVQVVILFPGYVALVCLMIEIANYFADVLDNFCTHDYFGPYSVSFLQFPQLSKVKLVFHR